MNAHSSIRAVLAGEAHVFLCETGWAADAATLAPLIELLDAEERGRLLRYRSERDARAFSIARALVRTALSLYADIPPADWRFRVSAHGRPEIDGPSESGALRFNLSHTRDLVACVVSESVDVGIDVEGVGAGGDPLALAAKTFSAREIEELRSMSNESRGGHFLSVWTLKEAYAKARGLGLSLPLNQTQFTIENGAIRASFAADAGDRPEDWSFCLMKAGPAHRVAAAVRAKCSTVRVIHLPALLPKVPALQEELSPVLLAATAGCSFQFDSRILS